MKGMIILKKIIIDDIELDSYSQKEIENLIKNKEIFGFIYITQNLINNKFYIGQRKIYEKWKTYLGSGTFIKKAISKHGKENFKRYIIYYAKDQETLNEYELFYTKVFNVVKSKQWYNVCYGGGGTSGYHHTEEHKSKLSKSKIGKLNPNYNRIYTDEERRLLSEKFSGVNNPMYGKRGTKSPNYGRNHSEETKIKMSNSAKGEKNHNYGKTWSEKQRNKYKTYCDINGGSGSKKVNCYDLNGNFIRTYKNAKEASIDKNLNHSHICERCRNKNGRCGAYQWRYYDDFNNCENISSYNIKNKRGLI